MSIGWNNKELLLWNLLPTINYDRTDCCQVAIHIIITLINFRQAKQMMFMQKAIELLFVFSIS